MRKTLIGMVALLGSMGGICPKALQNSAVACRMLDQDIDLALLRQEFEALRNHVMPRSKDDTCLWHGIPLKNALGTADPAGLQIRVSITKDCMKECYPSSLLKKSPYIQAILDRIEERFATKVGLVRIFKLPSESSLPSHTDGAVFDFDLGKVFRLHIPIITSPSVKFIINGKAYYLEPGKLYYTNVSLPHQVINNGSEERIHLIIDVQANEVLHDFILQSPQLSPIN